MPIGQEFICKRGGKNNRYSCCAFINKSSHVLLMKYKKGVNNLISLNLSFAIYLRAFDFLWPVTKCANVIFFRANAISF